MSPTDSDSDDDRDYVPPEDDNESDSANEQNNLDEPPAPSESDAAEQKRRRDALWATFQASVSTPTTVSNERPPSTAPKLVHIEKTYLFAGKHVTQVVEVPEDSEEAAKWPRWTPGLTSALDNRFDEAVTPESDGKSTPAAPSLPPTPIASAASPPAVATTSTSTINRPGPRKPRTTLPLLPSKTSHAKKISTLDKSAMDWRTHVAAQTGDVQDELDVNRRGGGYLEKVDFLKRVQDRRDDAFEASKASKRRRA